ncbi:MULTISPECIES: helix-turn-helix domain-containing protein [Corynebacterium]|uniref:helix-turn-helix domain-containing protein n=1 Tax=Corynebacterium TaxID=1716 RepID=UPI0009F2FD97|nr:XRE family transcriptional regulator [Corynebacterium coyleae]
MDAHVALGLSNARQQTKLVRQLKEIRQASGLTVEDVAREANLEPSFVAKFERGGMNFSASTLRTIARVLGAELRLDAKRPGSRFVSQASSARNDNPNVQGWSHSGARPSIKKTFTYSVNSAH